ncbi:hypothetical protein X798_05460 [Onchocerca flexuosa]|uniref:Uncharacterized protein n=1 Tax=Onchocerca flexuosa TaxID=387005 RepID=A0A238BS74_9BILA|nr:hypothetical protein X798_05460 [Onchocerca flexuosa]
MIMTDPLPIYISEFYEQSTLFAKIALIDISLHDKTKHQLRMIISKVKYCSWIVRSWEGTLHFWNKTAKNILNRRLQYDMRAIFSKESTENHLNNEQKATARAFEAMAENSLEMAKLIFDLSIILMKSFNKYRMKHLAYTYI